MSTVLNDFCEEAKADYENIKSNESAGIIKKEKKISFQFMSLIKVNSPYTSSMLLDTSVVFYHIKENEKESINVKLLANLLEEYFDYLKNNQDFNPYVNQMSFVVKVYAENNTLISQSKTDFGFIKQIEAEKEKNKLHTDIKDLAILKKSPDTRI